MENTEIQDTPSSISAASISYAVFRAAEREKDSGYFTPLEIGLMKHLSESAVSNFPDTKAGKLLKHITSLSHEEQRQFVNKQICKDYDDIFLLRKFFIRQEIEKAIENGATQIVVLGGGYDIRALFSSTEHKEVNFYELDRGPTREAKLKGIKTIPSETLALEIEEIAEDVTKINSNFYMLNCDLNHNSIHNLLLPNGFKTSEQSFLLAEGLTTYIDQKNNEALLATIHRLFEHEKSVALIGYVDKASTIEGIAEEAHKEHKEDLLFAIPADNAINFIKEQAFAIRAKIRPTNLFDQINKPETAEFYRGTSIPVENYYMIQRNSACPDQYENINLVPEIVVTLPSPKQHNEASSQPPLIYTKKNKLSMFSPDEMNIKKDNIQNLGHQRNHSM